MNPRRRIIYPDREATALDRIPGHLIITTLDQPNDLHIGRKAQIVMAINDAQVYGARITACCELIGINVRTYERWKKRIGFVLNALGKVGVR